MSTQVMLTLPDDVYERAKQWAALTQREVSHILTEALAIVLTPVGEPLWTPPVTALSDAEVMALAQVQMAPSQGKRLDRLLEKQREHTLIVPEQAELLALMQVYHQLWLRQSEALAEAVRRGLRAPLTP
jgi:predicted transcriptional regulator